MRATLFREECFMPDPKDYKQFVSQFNLSEWKLLCRHRLFVHFLKIDLKQAACIAADVLERPVNYIFPEATKPGKERKPKETSARKALGKHHRRFRL